MDDNTIVELYWQRDEQAIAATRDKYGRYCYAIAYGILHSAPDAEECENDTYLDAWNSMPPEKPTLLQSFLGMITRRRAIDRYRRKNAEKRKANDVSIPFHELEECVTYGKTIDEEIAAEELAESLNEFLRSLSEIECNVFLRRYFYFDPISDICARYGFGQSKVKMMLKRTREKLSEYLSKEGILI